MFHQLFELMFIFVTYKYDTSLFNSPGFAP